jgi:peptide/nickel transport system substrate-binding protein
MSEDYPIVPIVRYDLYNAFRSDAIDASSLGAFGASIFNTEFWVNSTPTNGDDIIAQTSGVVVSTTNHLTTNAADALNIYGTLVNSPLVEYNQNRELRPSLAEDWSQNSDGTQYTFTLADATFHNGDPVTPEDVKWTYEFYNDNADLGALLFPGAIESIEVVDDSTVRFNLERPDPLWFQTVIPQFGILNRDYWVENGAEDAPEEFEMGGSDFVGSGPFEISSHSVGESLTLTPHNGHPAYSPEHGITFTSFGGDEPAYLAFRDGDIDLVSQISLRTVDRIEQEMQNDAEVTVQEGLFAYYLFTQESYAPGKFKEYRQALGMCVNREEVNQNVFFNRSDTATYSSWFWENYPHFPGTDEVAHFVDDPSGEPEGAREVLREAGWGWDDNGDLHYPPEANLEPQWPKGETPDPDEFPCLNEDGEIIDS